ncbi:MAG: tRNA 2-thiouridine(34) synthase MnmA, partial [Candidatus Micrarchaeota archaeon]
PVWRSKCKACKAQRENACCTRESLAIAKRVCAKLGVRHVIVDARRDFERDIIGYFIRELKKGRTPSPCVFCNRRVKIARLLDWARERGIRFVATGHYAKITKDRDGNAFLVRPKDAAKDQTYGLCLLPQPWLKRLVFPLGDYTKQEVYDLAIGGGFEFFGRVRQSQDLCFVSNNAMREFITEKIGFKRGPIIEADTGKKIGEHDGLFFYTVGQRRGLSFPFAHYVKEIDVKRNALIVTRNREQLKQKCALVEDFNWVSGERLKRKTRVFAQIRHHQRERSATAIPKSGHVIEVVFDEAQEGIAPGQVLALYCKSRNGEVCLGGGVITNAA